MPKSIPTHLKRYIAKQDYSRYSSLDQAVWRYILRQLIYFLKDNAHACYVDGLKRTGISSEKIPKISEMDKKLRKFGWGAVPVSGFIPPAAFMEFQSLGYLPIACELRSIEHIHYTPAPDIVHEAAGHAPIIIDKNFSSYLKNYAEVAAKAIISSEDLDVYDAIRKLSDAKERQGTTESEIKDLERRLEGITGRLSNISEAGLLSRMNWWTAEYGLIGTLDKPKIFGAGLLSSIGEARECLSDKVKKLPLAVDCIDYSYDITEPQPQLFVTPDFKSLSLALDGLANKMAFRRGGKFGLEQAVQAKTINTVQLDTGLQISGRLYEYKLFNNEPSFIKFQGGTQLAIQQKELPGHGKTYHKSGYSTPIGNFNVLGILKPTEHVKIKYESGILVSGKIKKIYKIKNQTILITLIQCSVSLGDELLYDPSWGPFDLALGQKITSVFGGPADSKKYGIIDTFVASKIRKPTYSSQQKLLFKMYSQVRHLRGQKPSIAKIKSVFEKFVSEWPKEWLLGLEIYELSLKLKKSDFSAVIQEATGKNCPENYRGFLADGIKIAHLKL